MNGIDIFLYLIVVVAVFGVLALILRWLMGYLEVPAIVQKCVWVLVFLIALLAVAGAFGFGPMRAARWW